MSLAWLAALSLAASAPVLTDAEATRAERIAEGLRCVVCQNQSVADSDAPLARDLRALVAERVAAGDTDQEVRDHLADRYGDYVLLRPRLSARNAGLWAAPGLVLIAGGLGAWAFVRGQRRAPLPPEPLSAEERAELERLRG